MILSNAAVRNRTTVGVLMVLIIVAGLFSYFTLPREAAPDVPIPYVLVSTIHEGVSPEDVESTVTMKIEQKLTGLKGVKEITSTSSEGMSVIVIEFLPDIRIEDALQYVRDKVDQAKPDLPNDAEEPSITEVNIADFPIMIVNVSGPISPLRLKAIAEALEDQIEQFPGVLECDVIGAREREIRLEFDPDRLAAYEIGIGELVGLIPGENVNVSAGTMELPGAKVNVRVPGEFERPVDIDHLLLTVRDGKPIYLADAATVRDTFKYRESIARLDGQPSITLTVKKRVGSNILEIAKRVKALLAEARRRLPAGVTLGVTLDYSDDINMMVADLENNILSGLVLVVGVLMLFMGFRTSLIVGLAIPLSMLTSFAILSAMGITLNMIVLFSLILSLGMLVDNAIVIVETVYRFMQMGHSRIEAAMKGTAEVAWPVITSTATTVAAFAPLLLWSGVMGEFMKYLPITVITVLSSSLFVAMVISPVAATVLARAKGRVGDVQPNAVQRVYRRVLHAALHATPNRTATLALAVLSLAAVFVLYVKYEHGMRLFPAFDPRHAFVEIRSPQGTSIQYSDLLARMAEQRLGTQREHLEHINTNVGGGGGDLSFTGGGGGSHMANITLRFHKYAQRTRPSAEVIDEIRRQMTDIPGAEIKVAEEREGPPTGAAVAVRIAGEQFETLAEISERAKDLIADVPGLVNLRSDYEASRPELQFIVDRQRAALMNVNTNLVGEFLKAAVFGREVGKYRQFNDEYDITVRLPLDRRRKLDELTGLHVPNAFGEPVPLSNLGQFVYRGGYGNISRVNEKRVITLTGDTAPGTLPETVLGEVTKRLTDMQVPEGYAITYAGQKEEEEKAKAFLLRAYLIAVLVILMILVAQFNTLGVPIIIMATVGLSMVGVGVGLLVTGTPFVIIMTGIGLISLAGVVVNNAIVLLDYTRQLERRGLPLVEAAIQAGMTRLRPVLLTATTTILSLVPMATGTAFDFHSFQWVARTESSQWWAPMANAVIFGLGFATILTLVVVPTMYVAVYAGLERIGLGGLRHVTNGDLNDAKAAATEGTEHDG